MDAVAAPHQVAERVDAQIADPLAPGAVLRLVAQLPDPSRLPPGSWVEVVVGPPKRSSLWARWRKAEDDGPNPALAVACTALLSAGYVSIRSDGARSAFGRASGA